MTILNQQHGWQDKQWIHSPGRPPWSWGGSQIRNFNKESIVLPLGQNNPVHQLKMGTAWLNSSNAEKKLGITEDTEVNESKWQALIVSKAKWRLGCIRSCKASRRRHFVLTTGEAILNTVVIPKSRGILRDWRGCSGGLLRQVRLKYMADEERSRDLSLFIKKEVKGNLIAACKHLKQRQKSQDSAW